MNSTRDEVVLLYRRAGFGADAAQLEAATAAGFDKTVDRLLAGLSEPDRAKPKVPLSTYGQLNRGHGNTYDEYLALINWWLDKMAETTTPLREKLTLLLHGQFPTGFSKVGVPIFMYHQNELFRTLGPGSFQTLTLAVSKDPAMLVWLDANTDVRSAPNENFARELMERFTMGIGNYTQKDVEESARAFTGWGISSTTGKFEQTQYAHDFGDKTFLGHSGDLDGQDVIEIVTHTPASARWVTSRMWSWLAYPVQPNAPVVTELAASYAKDLNMTNLLRSIFMHPNFRSTESAQGLVKQPIEWVAGIMRAFHLRAATFQKSGGSGYLQWVLSNLGQIPFDPATVGGWGANGYWLSTASSLAQLNFAQNVVAAGDIHAVEEASGPDRIDALGELLGIDSWSTQSRTALNRARDEPPQLVTLALTAPEVVAN